MVLPAGRLASGKQERGRDRLMEMTTSSSALGEEFLRAAERGLKSSAGRFCTWEETLQLETSFFSIRATKIQPF